MVERKNPVESIEKNHFFSLVVRLDSNIPKGQGPRSTRPNRHRGTRTSCSNVRGNGNMRSAHNVPGKPTPGACGGDGFTRAQTTPGRGTGLGLVGFWSGTLVCGDIDSRVDLLAES